MRNLVAMLVAAVLSAASAYAEVVRFDVTSRTPIAGYPYERIAGRVTYSVDPKDPRNAVIVDLDKAPRTPAGRVEFSGDIVVMMPTRGGNGVTLLDVVNRGSMVTSRMNRPLAGAEREVGDGFLLKRGFTIVAVGWEFDTGRGNGQITLDAPIASDNGRPITGIAHATFVPERADATMAVGDLAGYPSIDPAGADSLLTVRDAFQATGTAIARDKWQLSGNSVTLTGGFEPGRVYELAYRASNPRVGGVGFLAVRDVAAWMKHATTAPITTQRVYGVGVSQTGRFLRDFIYHGCNTDEQGRQVFDALMIHIAGSSRTDLNRRWGTPVSVGSFAATSFPFADAAQRDPITGASDGELDNPRARQNQPKAFYTNTGVEYWGGARAAALLIRRRTVPKTSRRHPTCACTSSPDRSTGPERFRRPSPTGRSSGESHRLLVVHASVAGVAGQVGARRCGAAGEHDSKACGWHADQGIRRGVPRDSWRPFATDTVGRDARRESARRSRRCGGHCAPVPRAAGRCRWQRARGCATA
jgi:hypothetical protein